MYLLLAVACTADTPADPTTTPTPGDSSPPTDTATSPPVTPLVAVGSYFGGTITLYDRADGSFWGSLDAPGAQTITVGPDGSWIVCAEEENEIRRFDPTDLSMWEVLLREDRETAELEAGGLDGPTAAAWGPDGRLYVSSFNDDRVLRFESDGTFVDTFVLAGDGGLDGPDIALAWDDDGDLYVPSWYGDAVLRYDGATGAFVEVVLDAEDGLAAPRGILFDEAGTLWASGNGSDVVLRRYADGAVDMFAEVRGAAGMALEASTVLVASSSTDAVRVYDRATGDVIEMFTNDERIDGITTVTLLPRP